MSRTLHPFWRGQGAPPPMGGSPLAVGQRMSRKPSLQERFAPVKPPHPSPLPRKRLRGRGSPFIRVGPNAVNLRGIPCPHRHPGESRGPEKLKKTVHLLRTGSAGMTQEVTVSSKRLKLTALGPTR